MALDPLEIELMTIAMGCWKLNLGPLQEQQVVKSTLLTTEPSLQPHFYVHLSVCLSVYSFPKTGSHYVA